MIQPFRFIFLLLLVLLGWQAKAQSGYTYLDIAGGYHFMPSQGLTGTVSLEFAGKRRNSFELMGEAYHNNLTAHENYTLGIIYKPLISKNKNTSFRFRIGGGIGTNNQKFIAAPQAGFELSQAFGQGWEIMIQQKNYYMIWDTDKWRLGLALGIKIPII